MITVVFADFEKKIINFEPLLYFSFGSDIIYNGDEIPENTEDSGRYLDDGIGGIIVELDEIIGDLGAIPLGSFVEANHEAFEEPEVWSKAEEWFPLDAGIKTLSELLICLQSPPQTLRKKLGRKIRKFQEKGLQEEIIEEVEYLKKLLEEAAKELPATRFKIIIQ